jgi:hypothetical protein
MRVRRLTTLAVGALVALALAAPAHAAQRIESFTVTSSDPRAGAHPDIRTTFELEDPGQPEAAKNVTVNMPEGLFGDANAVTKCSSSEFAEYACPSGAQVGLVTVRANYLGDEDFLLGTAPLYNIVPRNSGETARLVFLTPILNIPISIRIAVRTASDYGLRFTVSEITQVTPLAAIDMTIWGFPASFKNNVQRFPKGSLEDPAYCAGVAGTPCLFSPTRPGLPSKPLTVNPTVCTGAPLTARLGVQTYQDPGGESAASSDLPPTTECENQTFNPVIGAGLTTEEADAPSGLDISLKAPQFLGEAVSPSELKGSIVKLPPGLTINPDAADGQTSCSDAQANFGNEDPSACPDTSKIGTFAIHSPALDGPLNGSLYIGEPIPGTQYRVFMVAEGFGINAKLVATFHPDEETGRLTLNVTDLPQVPFSEFELHLFASDRGLMATPTHCTIYPIEGRFFPWNDSLSSQNSVQFVSVTSGPNRKACPGQTRPFNPRLVAGSSNPEAGDFSDFRLRLERDDGDQFLGDLNFRMPPGFSGDLRGISYCPESSIAAAARKSGRVEQLVPSCPASSQIGTTNVGAGPGSKPFNAVGKMYLSGPLKGAPLSLAAVTPALAGPYDYGVVVVRVALHVDPLTAQVSAVSDTVPAIIGGIPIRMRSIQVNIDRPNFTINPTKCTPFTVDSQGIGDQGTVTDFSSYFHVVNCSKLAFKPKMAIRQLNKKTSRAQNPSLRFDLRTRRGDANISSIAVTLSHAFEIDQRHLGNICSEKELAEKQCAGRTPIGKATTTTPLLDQPLSGPVYAVSGSGGLPRLAFILDGQVSLVPRADTTTNRKGQLKTTVPVVPDAPVGHFSLTVFGGKTGYLINTRDLCRHTPVTRVSYTGQNGKTRSESVRMKMACGRKSAKRR